ncbi:MAG TPA: prenyltransferase/squalene oxidase repeat-containing protein [Candidatus Lokiarchaeia archaeon]|nr:prenyltransferase/squalene oxidase repeat-containing protein [Candidatus Lokiarchaeia archaeon]
MKRATLSLALLSTSLVLLLVVSPYALALSHKAHITSFINSTRIPTGGFQATPIIPPASGVPVTGNPDVISTAQAIEMSIAMGNTSTDFSGDGTWVLDLKGIDGGFGLYTANTGETMINAYYACYALNATGKLQSLGSAPHDWIYTLQNTTNGGFADIAGGNVSTLATYYAIGALYYLQNTTSIESLASSVVNYLNQCKNSDNGYGSSIGAPSDLAGTWASVATMARIAQVNNSNLAYLVNSTLIQNYVNQSYFSNASDTFNYGGYGTTRASIADTFYAMAIYTALGVKNPYAQQVEDYLLGSLSNPGCQNVYDGGFADKTTDASTAVQSSMTMTYYAFKALQGIDSTLGMLNGEAWFLPLDWIPLAIIAAVAVVVIIIGVRYYRAHRD